MSGTRRLQLIALALFVVFAIAAVAPIRNYDLFWHLATGRWIVEHRALPESDPFAVASEAARWINGEWLYQIAVYGAHEAGGVEGLSVVRALFAALVFTLAFLFARRDAPDHVAALLTAIAFAGASPLLDVRPASIAMLFVVLSIASRSVAAHAIITIFWINTHPSALLAPGIAGLTTRRIAPVLASALALLVNPYGYRAVLAPLELMALIETGDFVNAEWLPSPPAAFPLLYICTAIGVVAFVVSRRRGDWWRVLLFAGFAFLAIRHVRNQPLFFAAFPLLIAPAIPAARFRPALAWAATALVIAFAGIATDHRLGVSPERFPIRATARLLASRLGGNIYNPDQFGGYLIWTFYPERRVLTDGRNELHREYIREYAVARRDERAWRALLRKYAIDLAVDEYRPPIEVIDATTREVAMMPASLAYWPRDEWALIGFDEAAMVFARRDAFPAEVLRRWEIRGVVPDAVTRSRRP